MGRCGIRTRADMQTCRMHCTAPRGCLAMAAYAHALYTGAVQQTSSSSSTLSPLQHLHFARSTHSRDGGGGGRQQQHRKHQRVRQLRPPRQPNGRHRRSTQARRKRRHPRRPAGCRRLGTTGGGSSGRRRRAAPAQEHIRHFLRWRMRPARAGRCRQLEAAQLCSRPDAVLGWPAATRGLGRAGPQPRQPRRQARPALLADRDAGEIGLDAQRSLCTRRSTPLVSRTQVRPAASTRALHGTGRRPT